MRIIVLALGALASFLCVCDGARILTVMPIPAPSHHIWFSSLPVALAERGHDVYSIDIKMPKKNLPKLNVSLLSSQDHAYKQQLAHVLETFQKGTIPQKFDSFATLSVASCQTVINDKAIQEIISPNFKRKFDVIILNYVWHECLFGLIHRFDGIPMIVASPFNQPLPIFRQLGNPLFHGTPHFFMTFPVPMNFGHRLTSMAMLLYDEYMYHTRQEPAMDELLKKYFGDDCPPVRELVKHIALGFVNIMDTKPRLPLVANIIPVGGMHIPPVEPLSKDMKDFLDGAKDGAVIMSFGSLVRGDGIGADKVAAVLKVFSKLPQRLVWKYESAGDEKFANLPSNIKLLSWLPQNDLLAHPNVRLFISHCGGLSTQEATFYGIPILGTPFMVDQYANVEQIVTSGLGLQLPLEELTEETLYGNVTVLLNNPKYYETAQRTKSVMQDVQVKPIDRAVFHVEYVLRHRGAPHLRSPLADLPYTSRTLYVDLAFVVTSVVTSVVAFFALVLGVAILMLRKVFCSLKRVAVIQVTDNKKNN